LSGLKNIFLSNTSTTNAFSAKGMATKKIPKFKNPNVHANYIRKRLNEEYARSKEQKKSAAIKYKKGTYLQFEGSPGYDLKIDSLNNQKMGIKLLNIQQKKVNGDKNVQQATVYIPDGKENYFLNKVNDFFEKTTVKGLPRNSDLINSINDINLAMVDAFWTGDKKKIPIKNKSWCEVWIDYDSRDLNKVRSNIDKTVSEFIQTCSSLKIDVDDKIIEFPERCVKLIYANKKQLSELIKASDAIAEFRSAPIDVNFFTQLNGNQQQEWIDDLLSRTSFTIGDVAVCVLDTGVASEHPLLKPTIKNDDAIQVENDQWSLQDKNGHGTEVAGIAVYNDLRKVLSDSNKVIINHGLESVKILPDNFKNRPELYGYITQNAVNLAEINNPTTKRIICMAITDSDFDPEDGSPSSWSAAIDQITAGDSEDDSSKNLFFISAGNVNPEEAHDGGYPMSNIVHPVEDPAQSWNALTIGAYNDDIEVKNPVFKDFSPVADKGELSPYSSTSVSWSNSWPVKPELLLNGGNMVTNGNDFDSDEELGLLTTNSKFTNTPLSSIWGTSSAVAQASWMAAELYSAYPNMWPETCRALLVHSAEWTPQMRDQFLCDDKKTSGRRQLLRTCGYGIPDLNRAKESRENAVNLIIQDVIQPYTKDGKMNEMKFHEIPWPKEILQDLGEANAKLKVTLSYFIEPGPGRIGWKNKYRYSSFVSIFMGQDIGFGNIAVIGTFLVSLLMWAIFVYVEKHVKSPLIDLKIFRIPRLTLSLISALLVFSIGYYANVIMPFYLTNFRSLSTELTGLIMMAIPLANVIAAPIAGIFTDEYNATSVSLCNLFVYAIPLLFLTQISANNNLIFFTLMIALLGIGNGGFQNNPMIMGYAPQEYQGIAGSLAALFRNIGMGIGVSLATTSLYYGMGLKAHKTVNYYPKNNPSWFLSGMHFAYITAFILLVAAIILVFIIRKIDKSSKKA